MDADAQALAIKLAELDSRERSNTKRLDHVEKNTDVLTRLVTSFEVMAERIKQMSETVDRLDGKVSALEAEPGQRWKDIVSKCIWAVVGGILMYFLAKLGI